MRTNQALILLSIASFFLSCNSWQRKPKLEDTILSIIAKQDVEEWITAEYYGEALSSYQEILTSGKIPKADLDKTTHITSQGEDEEDNWEKAIEEFYEELYETLLTLQAELVEDGKKNPKTSAIKRKLNQNHKELVTNPFYRELRNILGKRYEVRFIKEVLANRTAKDFLRKAENQVKKNDKNQDRGKVNKKRLVLLGRGWVKAGMDFSNLTSSPSLIDQNITSDTIKIRNVYPRILIADINPWFIPNTHPGFEIIEVRRGGRFTFKEVQEVKTNCKRRLIYDAIERGILDIAIKNAEEQFLRLLQILGYTEIKAVQFEIPEHFSEKYLVETDYNFGLQEPFTRPDTLVTTQELERIQAMVHRRPSAAKKQYLKDMETKHRGQVEEGSPVSAQSKQ